MRNDFSENEEVGILVFGALLLAAGLFGIMGLTLGNVAVGAGITALCAVSGILGYVYLAKKWWRLPGLSRISFTYYEDIKQRTRFAQELVDYIDPAGEQIELNDALDSFIRAENALAVDLAELDEEMPSELRDSKHHKELVKERALHLHNQLEEFLAALDAEGERVENERETKAARRAQEKINELRSSREAVAGASFLENEVEEVKMRLEARKTAAAEIEFLSETRR